MNPMAGARAAPLSWRLPMSTDKSTPPAATAPLSTAELQGPSVPGAARLCAYLLVAHREGVETVPLLAGTSVVIGREPPADLAIPDRGLSRRHARFTLVAAAEAVVEDLGSMNGTRVGGARVERASVRPGDDVRLGPIAVSLHVVTGDERPVGLGGHEGFRRALDEEIARARFFGRPLAMLMVRALAERGEPLVAWAPRICQAARAVDRVALYGAEVVEILLPEAGRDQALALARSIAAIPRGALGCGLAFIPGAASAEALIEACLDALRRTTIAQPIHSAMSDAHRTIERGRAPALDGSLVMESPAMREVVRTAARLANAVIPVLLHGETGTGKEVLARLIHEGGPRRDKPLVAVNCGAIPAELLESTLFGHERGSFTGAAQLQKGLFEAADGGTILLDEIGELPPAAQVALLRVLEEKRVRRVGSAREIDVDVRVIAATHRDLDAMAEAGTFRRDLLYRLDAMVMSLPPLRARRPDLAPLAELFLAKAARANGRDVRAITPEANTLLERYPWPGNVRELRNAIERAVVVAEGDAITPRDLPERVRAWGGRSAPPATPRSEGPLKERVERFERDQILEALREANNNQTEAARLLAVPLRTLQHKLGALGIKRILGHGPGAPEGG